MCDNESLLHIEQKLTLRNVNVSVILESDLFDIPHRARSLSLSGRIAKGHSLGVGDAAEYIL